DIAKRNGTKHRRAAPWHLKLDSIDARGREGINNEKQLLENPQILTYRAKKYGSGKRAASKECDD
ncbi:hypothetical protein KIN20_020336, partial [Parelaphostrongylus tenuis]